VDRKNKGIKLAPDAPTCPVCHEQLNIITVGHYRKHGYADVKSFKKAFGLKSLTAPSICAKQSSFMAAHSPTKGTTRTPAEIVKMGQNRKGKGIGVAGKYKRTAEIRSKIADGVLAFMAKNPGFAMKHFKAEWISCEKADAVVWVRSSWERRVLWVLDQYPEVESVDVEPFTIPYLFKGAMHKYLPDFLVTFEGDIQEIWEIKPECYTRTPKNIAKFDAAEKYAKDHGMTFRVVTESNMTRMERLAWPRVLLNLSMWEKDL
jgi:hypothetical protein